MLTDTKYPLAKKTANKFYPFLSEPEDYISQAMQSNTSFLVTIYNTMTSVMFISLCKG